MWVWNQQKLYIYSLAIIIAILCAFSGCSSPDYKASELEVRQNNEGEWCAYKGTSLAKKYTGLAQNQFGWWYITDGKVDFNYSGTAENDYGPWIVKGGKVVEPKWHQDLRDNGFTDEEIRSFQKIYDSIGISNINVIDYSITDTHMSVLRSYPYSDHGLVMATAFEDRHIYSITMSGMMYGTKVDSNNFQSDTVRFYNIDDGGRLAYYDWDNQKINIESRMAVE